MITRNLLPRFGILLAAVAAAGCVGTSGNAPTTRPLATIDDYATALANKPSYERGTVHFAAGSFGLALQAFQQALIDNQKSIAALNGIAATYDQLGRYDLSKPYYGRALALKPQSVQTLNNIGYSSLLQNSHKRARRYLDAALKVDQDNAVVKENLAIAQGIAAKTERITVEPAVEKAETSTPETPAQQRVWVETSSRQVQTLVTKSRAPVVSSALLHPSITEVAKSEGAAHSAAAAPDLKVGRPTPMEPVRRADTSVAMRTPDTGSRSAREIEVARLDGERTAPIANAAPPPPRPTSVVATTDQHTGAAPEAAGPIPSDQAMTRSKAAKLADQEAEATRPESAAIEMAALKPAAPPAIPPALRPTDAEDASEATDERMEILRTRFEVSNGAGRRKMAARMRGYLVSQGIGTYYLTNATHYRNQVSTIFYRTGYLEEARRLSSVLQIPIELVEVRSQRADVRLRLGGDLLDFDRDLIFQ